MINKYMFLRLFVSIKKYIWTFAKWLFISVVIGLAGGGAGTLFYKSVSFANEFRKEYPFIIFFLPLGGLAIAGLYKLCKLKEDPGTNLIISSVRSEHHVPVIIAPLIFISTVITHLLGGSAGREGGGFAAGRKYRRKNR